MGTPRIGDHIGCGLGQWKTPLRRPPLAGPAPKMIHVDPIYHCAETSLSCWMILCSVTFTVFQCVSWTALLKICQKHRDTLGRGIGTPRLRDRIGCGLGQWGTPLRRPPLAGPTPRMILVNPISLCYHCAKTSLMCCILLWLFSMAFTVFQFVSWTALLYICQKHRVTLGLGMGTPWLRDHIGCGLSQWGAPLRRPPLAGPPPRMIPVNPKSTVRKLHYWVAYRDTGT